VKDFAEGRVNEEYPESTEIRRAILLVQQGKLRQAQRLLRKHAGPLSRYRSVALYYLGVIAYREGDRKETYRLASLLETSRPDLSRNLHLLLSREDLLYSKIAYRLTGDVKTLRSSGILSYNAGRYKIAYLELTSFALQRKGEGTTTSGFSKPFTGSAGTEKWREFSKR